MDEEYYHIKLGSTTEYLEEAFYPLETAKSACPKKNKNYERLIRAIKELEACHDDMCEELTKSRQGKE